ncbi:group-specific protein [Vibrio campbellii]|uniref:Group-specific protein n=1 Tax=Vibrio campbellii TaxID=680 RepID=A0ABY5ILP5_9VIBR|nr:group-specific protein [Vibrio campbellii]UTZ25212.1 group-specific protein [Vibrio campbellii]UTZ35208.1 group-specific protein [Vibrio campbellii]
MSIEEPQYVFVVRLNGEFKWYRSDRDLWVLDVNKWRNEFIAHGYEVPEFQNDYRFGIHSINQDMAKQFLDAISDFEVSKDQLSIELAKRFSEAKSWWDVGDLFPIMFVNFDDRRVGAFYSDGTPMERYVPDGWEGEFIDFANEYPEEVFPASEKFWVKGDSDLLKLLNERASQS